MKFKSDIEVQAGLKDSSGAAGTSGQVLSSNGTTVSWINSGGGVANDVQNTVKAGVAINKGQAVYVTGADGTNIIVGLASNATEATSSKTLGLLNATVAINGFADVIQVGKLSGLDTSTATVGDPVWLGTNGNLIYGLANKPYAPEHLVYIGVVTRVNVSNGEIFINVQNGFELKEIHDVDIVSTPPSNNEILAFEGGSVNLWKNKSISSIGGITGSGTTNTLPKFTGASAIGNSLVSESGTVVLGTASLLKKAFSANVTSYPTILAGEVGLGSRGSGDIPFIVARGERTDAEFLVMQALTSTDTARTAGTDIAFRVGLNNSSVPEGVSGLATSGTAFSFQNGQTFLMSIRRSGNVLINTTTDAGFRLDVNGTARATSFTGPLLGNATTATTLQTTRSISLGTAVTSTATNFNGSANITIPITGVSEAYLTWGGRNLSGSYGPVDAALMPDLGANRLAFTPASAVTVEYSQDGGATWLNYAVSDSVKINLLNGNSTSIQVGGGGYPVGTDYTNYLVRVTINTAGQIYTALNKFIILVSTNGSSGSYCTIDARTQSNYLAGNNTWTIFSNQTGISGWSGYNVINTSNLTTFGNTPGTQFGQVRFTFGQTGYNAAYTGLQISKLLGFGGVGWQTPSTLAATGQMYTYDYLKNATFPAALTATSFIGPLTGNASTATTLQTARTINGTSFNGSANITTANWGTSRTITIGSTAKAVDGSGNVSWTLAEIGATTVGGNMFTLANPGAITFPRFNANNTVSALDAASFRTAIGAGTGSGTVTSVAALTLGTTGTDLSSTVANGTTTPVITLNVPTASATNRGALSAADWTTFNNKQNALTNPVTGTGTTNYVPKFTGTSTLGNSLIYDNGTNVGIGTTSPINGGGAAKWITTEGTTNYSGGLVASINGNAKAYFYSQDNYAIVQGASSQGVKLMPNGADGVTVFSNGNVFIGTSPTDAGYKLDVNGSIRVGGGSLVYFNTTGSPGSNLIGTVNDFWLTLQCNRGNASRIDLTNGSGILFTDNGAERMSIASTGIKINNLAGTGTRLVTADANGVLSTTTDGAITTYNSTLTLDTTWKNTGVTSANLTTQGVYLVTCFVNDYGVGGGQYSCTYVGTMFFYTGGTNGVNANEIALHHSGHADNNRYIYLRTLSSVSAGDGKLYLQIKGNGSNSANSTYAFTFKKLL